MDKTTTLLLLLFLFTLLLETSLSKDLCHKDDKKTLLKIKKSLNFGFWDPKTDCCSWISVQCGGSTVNNRVNYLMVVSSEVSGHLPPEIGDLPYLETLSFYKLSNLTGTIPLTISKLKNLRLLRLSYTNLTGPVPEFLGQLKNLEDLDLSFNDHSGSIPSSLSSLPKLGYIDLSRNRLTGPIPELFGSFQGELPDLILSHNQLSGSIPKSLGNLDLYQIDLSRNKLKGDASMLFGANKTTLFIDISRNMLQFDLSKVNLSYMFSWLDLNHNRITGNIPVQWTELMLLKHFNVSYNRLCGRIPKGGGLQRFDSYAYAHNKCLCGAPLQSCK